MKNPCAAVNVMMSSSTRLGSNAATVESVIVPSKLVTSLVSVWFGIFVQTARLAPLLNAGLSPNMSPGTTSPTDVWSEDALWATPFLSMTTVPAS